MDDGTRAGLTGSWHGYLEGLAEALGADSPLDLEASSGEALLAEAEAWARQGPWPSGLFTREPTRVLVLTSFGGSDSDLSRAIARRLTAGFLHDQSGVPLPLRITLVGRQDGENARELLSRHLRQAGLTIADWRRLELPSLVTIAGLDDLLPPGRALPGSAGLEFLSELCSYELSQSRIMLVTRRQPDDTPHWPLITDRLDGGERRVTVLDAASSQRGPSRKEAAAGRVHESPIRESAWAFHVTAWPEWLENDDDARVDAQALSISVVRRGRDGLWALFMGLGDGQGPAWTAQARWIPAAEPLLLPLEQALALARELAPGVSVMGWTARQAIQDWTTQKGQGSHPDFPRANPLVGRGPTAGRPAAQRGAAGQPRQHGRAPGTGASRGR